MLHNHPLLHIIPLLHSMLVRQHIPEGSITHVIVTTQPPITTQHTITTHHTITTLHAHSTTHTRCQGLRELASYLGCGVLALGCGALALVCGVLALGCGVCYPGCGVLVVVVLVVRRRAGKVEVPGGFNPPGPLTARGPGGFWWVGAWKGRGSGGLWRRGWGGETEARGPGGSPGGLGVVTRTEEALSYTWRSPRVIH